MGNLEMEKQILDIAKHRVSGDHRGELLVQ
jgi:hypothetical protein